MKKLLSVLLVLCMLVVCIPVFAFGEDYFLDNYGFKINGISSQNGTVLNSEKTYESVYIIDFLLERNAPSEELIGWSFNNNYNDGKNIAGISINITLDIPSDYSYCHGICDVIISGEVEPGEYYFQVTYDGEDILSNDTNDRYSILTITESQAIEDIVTTLDAGRSLSLSEMLYINNYARIVSTGDYTPEYIRNHGGLLVFTQSIREENATYENALTYGYIRPGLIGGADNVYAQRTNGLTSREYRNTYYLRIYLQLKDGSYQYTELKPYGVYVYCQNKQSNEETSQPLKDVCQKLMEYGDAACIYFGTEGTA